MAAIGPAGMRRQLLIMVALVVAVDAIAIAIYHLAHIDRVYGPGRDVFVGVWTLVVLAIVLPQLRRIRRARFGTRPPPPPPPR
jgi:hypothetical protein